ncbi:MAG: hypothetical protein WBF58_10185 [Xanthobacteraceae bacterium]
MSTLEFGLKSFFRPRIYAIARDGAPAGEIECARMWERATITIGGTSCSAAREARMSGAFYLEANGVRLANAEKSSAMHRLFTMQVGGRTLVLKAASTFGRTFVLTERETQIGSIAPLGWFTRKCRAELPDDLAPEVQAFLIWLFIILLRRQQQAAMGAEIGAIAATGSR